MVMISVQAYCRLSIILGCVGYLMLCLYIMQEGYLAPRSPHSAKKYHRERKQHRADTESQEAGTSVFELTKKWDSYIRRKALSTLGKGRPEKGYLTIGIPSIWRITGMDYLLQTLDSLINTTSVEDKAVLSVLVFLADSDLPYNEKTAEIIGDKYQQYIADGFLQVIWLPEGLQAHVYPPLEGLKRTFNDKPSRVKWRAKQAVDYALMFYFSRNISRYYIQLEDDVICSDKFLAKIQRFVRHSRTRWSVLEFSELGFIGKLVRSRDLDRLAHFVLMFYDQQPVDWLLKGFISAMGQKERLLCTPTLFQHVGRKSSFDTAHDNKLVDKFFESK